MTSPENLIWIALALPLLGVGLVFLLGKAPNARDASSLVIGLLTLLAVWRLSSFVFAGERPTWDLGDLLPGFSLTFQVEPLGMMFALVAASLWILTTVYAVGYMRGHHEHHQTRFFACFAAAIFAALAAAFSANLFTLFIAYEVMTISTYPLVTHHGTAEARNGGRVYLGILLFTSIAFFMLAIAGTWFIAGTLDFRLGGILSEPLAAGRTSNGQLTILLGLFAFGIGKAALMPFHRWLPAAMVAPTPVSALLHAVAVVKVGVFSLLKVAVYIFGIDLLQTTGISIWLSYLAGASIVIASLVAITKDNLKARLAYSTISQLAYITLGAALATPNSILGGGMHIVMHAFGKITLFFAAGAIYVATNKKYVSELDGLGRAMPFTFGAFLLATISIIGLPPGGGAWSKWFLAVGAAETHQYWLIAALMISSLLNIFYLMPIPIRAFLPGKLPAKSGNDDSPPEAQTIKEAPWMCVVPLCITAVATVVLFIFADTIYQLLFPIVATGLPASSRP
ncbi:proton-conducting transporter membrane subunit [Planctomycetaceae bacterium SH139]